MDEDLGRKTEEDRILTMVKERTKCANAKLNRYVTRLQAYVRRMIAVKEYEKMRKKKKGKGGKKGKK